MGKSLKEIAEDLKSAGNKVQLIYAFNGAGKTRLSRKFRLLIDPKDTSEDAEDSSFSKVIYYNAFTEDLFYWYNDLETDVESDVKRELRTQPNGFTDWLVSFLEAHGLDQKIKDHFQWYTSDKITPNISSDFSTVDFTFNEGTTNKQNVKISRGEESNFIWSVFYSLLEQIIEERNIPDVSNRSTPDFNDLEYIFIDDPVSSLDDNHLIELAVDIANLVKSSESDLKYIITTHNPLFYNILSNELNNKHYKNPESEERKCIYRPKQSQKYRLNKNYDGKFVLDELGKNTPFSYHLFLLSEIKEAIKNNNIKKFHFGFLRNILEKTATFLGYTSWVKLLPKDGSGNPDPFANRILNLSNHSVHSGEEIEAVQENDKAKLEELITYLSSEYKFWQQGV